MAKQSREDRLKRLSEGRCVVHGLSIHSNQPDWILGISEPCDKCGERSEFISYAPYRCMRISCEIVYFMEVENGEEVYYLADDFKYLLD